MLKPPKIPESVLVVIYTPALDVLIIERADRPGFWQSVTGAKDRIDEPLEETAAREVAEETGIVVGGALVSADALVDWAEQIEYEIYPVWRHRYAEGVTRNLEHWFGL
ncbi:MAG: dihydroneopterin triphosphate diphosphatase, partial [Burkholderiales bacterium]|nr:dihydroneopterin triphosphate diphosphatase [Burkholderiales bacterium]